MKKTNKYFQSLELKDKSVLFRIRDNRYIDTSNILDVEIYQKRDKEYEHINKPIETDSRVQQG